MFKFLLPWVIAVPKPSTNQMFESTMRMMNDVIRVGYNRVYDTGDCFVYSKTVLPSHVQNYLNNGDIAQEHLAKLGYNLEVLSYQEYDSGITSTCETSDVYYPASTYNSEGEITEL